MQRHKELIEQRIDAWCAAVPSNALHAPMAYLLKLPAKRVRPIATLMACELFGGRVENALDQALGIELFHNFSLMHDDIMDASPLRRGDPTVHVKWDVNTAILSGDALLVRAYEQMGGDARVLPLFNRHALAVCEGQAQDMAFERRVDVTAEEYMEMIRLKTAVLLSCALQVGALRGGAKDEDVVRIGRFGEQLGLAFQLRDDLLDAFGDPKVTGKQRGGDLRAGKKTWLLIRGLGMEREQGTAVLVGQLLLSAHQRDVALMGARLEELGVRRAAEAEVEAHEARALEALEAISVEESRKTPLHELARTLMARRY